MNRIDAISIYKLRTFSVDFITCKIPSLSLSKICERETRMLNRIPSKLEVFRWRIKYSVFPHTLLAL